MFVSFPLSLSLYIILPILSFLLSYISQTVCPILVSISQLMILHLCFHSSHLSLLSPLLRFAYYFLFLFLQLGSSVILSLSLLFSLFHFNSLILLSITFLTSDSELLFSLFVHFAQCLIFWSPILFSSAYHFILFSFPPVLHSHSTSFLPIHSPLFDLTCPVFISSVGHCSS